MDPNNNYVNRQQRRRRNRKRSRGASRGVRSSSYGLPENIDQSQFQPPISHSFPSNCVGFPDRLVTILKYVEVVSLTGSATPAAQVWTVNSAFDPNNTGTGHQPSYFDTLTAVYSRYFVRAFKVECEVYNQLSTMGQEVVCLYSDQDISSSSVDILSEAKYAKWTTVGINSGLAIKRIKMPWMSTMKIMGQPYTEADDNMYSFSSSSPTDLAYCIFKAAAVDGTTPITAQVKTAIFMEICFKDLKPQISS